MDNVFEITLNEKLDMDWKIIRYLDNHIAERVSLEHKVRSEEFHKAVLALIDEARENGILDVNPVLSTEEVFVLLEMGVLSRNQKK